MQTAPDSPQFEAILKQHLALGDESTIKKLVSFREKLLVENKRQNLTRITEPQEFYDLNLIDVQELLTSGFLDFPAMDLGSGAGIPGLVAGIFEENPWILVESEKKKAEWLKRMTQEMNLKHVKVFPGRAEKYLEINAVSTIVARAVARVDRIFNWLEKCSTWNSLILLKGPAWEEEWNSFQKKKKASQLEIKGTHEYSVGPDKIKRIIVRIERKD